MTDDTHRPLVRKLSHWLESDLVVVDVGARWGVGQRWHPFGDRVRVIGFEPDARECARLNDTEGTSDNVEFVPLALGPHPGPATLHLTSDPGCSSLFRPIEQLIRHRPELACTAPAGTSQVVMSRLDDWLRTSGHAYVDVAKLDTQGSELGVLEGATEALTGMSMLEVEVEFNEIYEDQPLFGDVDRFLRDRGFVLWRLQQLVHYGIDHLASADVDLPDTHYFSDRPVSVAGRGGQLYWGHAYFVPRWLAFSHEPELPWQQAVRSACSAAAFGFVDLAFSALERGVVNASAECAADFADAFNGHRDQASEHREETPRSGGSSLAHRVSAVARRFPRTASWAERFTRRRRDRR